MSGFGSGSAIDRAPAASIVGSVLRQLRADALRLSLEARDYFGDDWPPDPVQNGTLDRLVKSREMLLIAARLSQVVLWVLAREAAAGSEDRGAAQAPAPWLLDERLAQDGEETGHRSHYPPRFQALRADSLALYRRVGRLHGPAGG